MKLDLNCDLGEGEPIEKTEALMRFVSSANIACGGHAGDDESIRACISLALKHDVRIGAHPGLQGNFGRDVAIVSRGEFLDLVSRQLHSFRAHLAEVAAVPLHHVKLHGTLYHQSENSAELRTAFVEIVRREFPGCIIYCLAGGRVAEEARSRGVPVWEETFLDRNYLPDGSLVSRNDPNALLSSTSEVGARLDSLLNKGQLNAIDGTVLTLRPRTLCIHSDSPNALVIAREASAFLQLKSEQAE